MLSCDALPQIQIQHDLSSVLLRVRLHADHLHGLRTQKREKPIGLCVILAGHHCPI